MRIRNNNYEFATGEDENRKFTFGNKTDYEIAFSKTPLFAYDYIDLDKTDYHFHQDCFDSIDVKHYFSQLKKIASKNIDELLGDHKNHFHIYHPEKIPFSLLKLFKQIFGPNIKGFLKPEIIPPFGQIALYTHPDGASKPDGRKSPRIYFIIYKEAVFHILFYDPYHEINPKK